MRAKIAQAAVVAVLSVSAIAYGALEKHVTVRVDDESIRMRTFAGTVAEALERAHVTLKPQDLVTPALDTSVREGLVIEVRPAKPITLLLNGKPRQVIVTARTVEEVIAELQLRTSLADYVGTARTARVTPGMVLVYREAVGIRIVHDGITDTVITNAASIRDVLAELGVTLVGKDEVWPTLESAPSRGLVVRILRVGTRMETASKAIPYQTQFRDDPSMESGRRAVRQSGRNGSRLVAYRVTYKDGKEVARKEVGWHVLRKPVPKIVAIGTGPKCICTRGTQSGKGTWYAAPSMTAAHPTLPFGTVVRVTNFANGKTVTVTIRDRGPYGEGRIIDLSKDAFAALAPLSEGVISVRIRW
ncbi:MAG: ubiquitin-like domain-containing protein [Actinomycetota bacterium]